MKRQSGFTLIEILITLLIISITVVLIASSFSLSLKSWSSVSAKVEVYQRVRVCLDMMSSRIRNAVIFPLNKNLTFKGDRYSLSFITTSSDFEGWTKVDFGIKKEEEFLWLEKEEELAKGEKIFLGKGIESIEFMYYDFQDGQWKESWDSSETGRLPFAVKIFITFAISNDKVEKITIPEVVIMIPAAMESIKESEKVS
ncbi:MAG: prepilin-type N-terminal cleavage/methylation domain-containing protein [bacterium]